VVAAAGASAIDGIRAAVALKLGLDPAAATLANFHPVRYLGPFWRCIDIILPEWQLIVEVPDITFLVTQDVDGNGTQQTIYDDPFGTNWNVNPTPNVTLVASSIAKETHTCQTPQVLCGDVPAILFAGLMPLDNRYFDATTGYALRPNRPANSDGSVTPVASDLTRPPAQTPFCETLQLYGCVNVSVGGVDAQYYRVLQSLDGGATFSAITGLSWNIYTFPGGVPVTIVPDANGWYAVLANPDDYHPARMVLEWPTPALGHQYTLKVQVGDGSKNVMGESPTVPIQVDNTAPTPTFTTLSWKFVGALDSSLVSLLGIPCPIIHRGTVPQDIEVVFAVNAVANHLRDAAISVSGCGTGSFALEPSPPAPAHETSHWYTAPADNNVTLTGRYTLSASASDGCYSFGCDVNSRAMNPSGADRGNLVPPDWYEDVVYIYVDPAIVVAVVSEN